MEDEVRRLYLEPLIGASYSNTYGEENILNLVAKYRGLGPHDMQKMLRWVVDFSTSTDLPSSFVSVGVLHALGKENEVQAAYRWAETREDAAIIISHFDIGKSVADHFVEPLPGK